MKSYRDSIVKFYGKLIVDRFSLRVFAEESEENAEGEKGIKSVINYEDLIAKARKEEKDKQYKVIEGLKSQITALTEQHNNDLLVKADLEKQLKDAKEQVSKIGKDDTEEVKNLKETLKKLEKEKEGLENQIKSLGEVKPTNKEELEAEIRAELNKEYEVKNYRLTKLAELKDELLVPELVIGVTKEEIDESLKNALERSEDIRKKIGATEKPKRTPKSPNNPSINSLQDKEFNLETLANMDVRSAEYRELRKKLGLK